MTIDDKSLIRALRLEKGWGMLRMIREFPQRQWKRSTLNDLIKKIDETGDTKRKQGSGRPRSVLTACWDEISEDTINRAIGQFRKRLSLVIAANGGHIEHHFD